jgi:hypothetical protein
MTRSIEQLEAEICELAAHMHAAEHRWLVLLREYDSRQGWAQAGFAVAYNGLALRLVCLPAPRVIASESRTHSKACRKFPLLWQPDS